MTDREPICRPVWRFHSKVGNVAVRKQNGEIRACCAQKRIALKRGIAYILALTKITRKPLWQAAFSAVCIRRNSALSARSKVKQDKGCMPPKGGICHFTPTGNAVREVQCVLPFGVCVKTGIPICRNKPILKRNAGIQKVFRKGKCYE